MLRCCEGLYTVARRAASDLPVYAPLHCFLANSIRVSEPCHALHPRLAQAGNQMLTQSGEPLRILAVVTCAAVINKDLLDVIHSDCIRHGGNAVQQLRECDVTQDRQ